MTNTVKKLILILGILSLVSGIYLAYKGAEFLDFFSGIFIGIVLIVGSRLSKNLG